MQQNIVTEGHQEREALFLFNFFKMVGASSVIVNLLLTIEDVGDCQEIQWAYWRNQGNKTFSESHWRL